MTTRQRFDGKTALVTGAGSGIGRSTAQLFAAEGAAVAVADINAGAAVETVNQIESASGRAVAIVGDISTEDGASEIVEATLDALGQLDILDNNAGVGTPRALADIDAKYVDWMVDINLKGTLYMSKHATAAMVSAGRGGAIVNVASMAGLRSRPNMPVYVATKGAVIALTKSLAIDFASHGVRTNCVCPLATDTPMLRAHFASVPNGEEMRQKNIEQNPLKRLGRADDIANTVLFLASDEASYINGQIIGIDGGSIAGTAQH